tara:strand:+ start:1752 stop:3365 length:1614 start_codon:yes stop_codon:yes gene_type:complete
MKNNIIRLESVLTTQEVEEMVNFLQAIHTTEELIDLLFSKFKIDCTNDQSIVKGFDRDNSNIKGNAEAICRPKNEKECSIILFSCQIIKIPITISAGRTNLNGSATPMGGVVVSIEKLVTPKIKLNFKNKTVISPVGIYLEDMRNEILNLSQNKLYYPVDPTSRKESMIGGNLSCNASGFVPGPQGATRYWTHSLDFLTLDGYKISCSRGQYISKDKKFILKSDIENKVLQIPNYRRPKIKNASGPYSCHNGEIDLVDLIIGSEGIFGLITSVTFRLKEMPNSFLDLFIILPTERNAIDLHKYILNYFDNDLSKISALEYFGYNCQNYMKNREYLFKNKNEVGIYLQIPLINESIDYAGGVWLEILANSNCGIDEDRILWLNEKRNWDIFFEARHSIPVNALEKTRLMDTCSILTDTIVPVNNFDSFLNKTHDIIQKSKIEYILFGHLGDCHLHFHLIPTNSQQNIALMVYDKIIDLTHELGGVYSAEHGTGKRKRSDFLKCYGSEGVESLTVTKKSFDPDFLLNRGNVIDFELNNK